MNFLLRKLFPSVILIVYENYYVDKTLLIKDVLEEGTSVSLFTRPRRFGKALAMTMLQTFFEDERDRFGEKIHNSHYFAGRKIADCEELCEAHMGKYPVISLSLKSAKQPTFEMAYSVLVRNIREEYRRHWYVCENGVHGETEQIKNGRKLLFSLTFGHNVNIILSTKTNTKKCTF